MLKRLAVAVSVSALAMLGSAAGASADAKAPASGQVVTVKSFPAKVKKAHRFIDWDAPGKAIDWDAPAPAPSDGGGTVTTQRIDWD